MNKKLKAALITASILALVSLILGVLSQYPFVAMCTGAVGGFVMSVYGIYRGVLSDLED